MSKILFVTDTHIGVRGGSKVFRQLFREYYRDVLFPYIKENSITEVIHAGDFFDNRNALSLADIDYIVNEFTPQFEETGATMWVIAGNHDVAFKNTNRVNSLALLKGSNAFKVIDNSIEVVETEGKDFVLCPWLNSENTDELMEELNFYRSSDNILVGHFEFAGMKMYKNSRLSDHGFDPKDFKKFDRVLSGHFHHPSSYGNVHYLGALFHYNWQDHGDWRGFNVYDPQTDSWESVENEFCLFTELQWSEELIATTDDDLNDMCGGQFVRIIIDEEYERVALKELIARVEKTSPISVDVIDNTVLSVEDETSYDSDDDDDDSSIMTVNEYAYRFMENMDDKDTMKELFDEIANEAHERMKEVE